MGLEFRRVLFRSASRGEGPSSLLSVQKPASLMVWGCVGAYDVGSLNIWKGTINVEQYKDDLEQYMLPTRQRLF